MSFETRRYEHLGHNRTNSGKETIFLDFGLVWHRIPPVMFHFREGQLHCEEILLNDLMKELNRKYEENASPFYVYSQGQIVNNVASYVQV